MPLSTIFQLYREIDIYKLCYYTPRNEVVGWYTGIPSRNSALENQLVLLSVQLTKIYPPLPTFVQPISITKTLLIVPTKNERDPPLFTGKLLIKFQNILRNTTQVLVSCTDSSTSWFSKAEFLKEITDVLQVTDKQYHIKFYQVHLDCLYLDIYPSTENRIHDGLLNWEI
jgi:hypothetical protein